MSNKKIIIYRHKKIYECPSCGHEIKRIGNLFSNYDDFAKFDKSDKISCLCGRKSQFRLIYHELQKIEINDYKIIEQMILKGVDYGKTKNL